MQSITVHTRHNQGQNVKLPSSPMETKLTTAGKQSYWGRGGKKKKRLFYEINLFESQVSHKTEGRNQDGWLVRERSGKS